MKIQLLIFVCSVFGSLPGTWPTINRKVAPVSEWTALYPNASSANPLPVISTCPNPKHWAATWDDGPSDQTPRILDILAKKSVKATFFVLGSSVVQRPDSLKQAYNAGHEIALHTWSHTSLKTLTNEEIIAEVMWNIKAVKDSIGVTPKYLRPPYGIISTVNIRRL
jgi:peptidoglycan/xylan/chitin deacetylase (PgdA/CDA1 family)